jgi:hypothetical protein
MSGGSTASGGYNLQAHAIAYVSTCILTARDLKWVSQQFGHPDVPIAVSAETGGPGDDLRVELGFATFEAQVKRGLNADARLDETIERFGNCDLQPALNIGAQVLRLTALSAAPPGSVETTAMLSFEVISSGRDLSRAMGRFLAQLKKYFALMPSQLDLIERQLRLFVTTRTLGRQR